MLIALAPRKGLFTKEIVEPCACQWAEDAIGPIPKSRDGSHDASAAVNVSEDDDIVGRCDCEFCVMLP